MILISYFAKVFLYLFYILWVIIFVSILKLLKERSLDHFGSPERKVSPRNKSFKKILLMSGKVLAVDEN